MQNPKKSLGQNFLIDKNLQNKIVSLINIKNKNIIEIGPGNGQITDKIISLNPKQLTLIEKDDNLYLLLLNKYRNKANIYIAHKDALTINIDKKKKFNVISNLPYNLSVKIIINLLCNYNNLKEMVFMVQKEVAEKMNYNDKSKINKLSFFLNIVSKYEKLFDISNKVFYPKPKIKSTIIRIKPLDIKIDKKKLWEFSKLIFKNKRKKIKNVIIFKEGCKNIDKLINSRAEDLNTKDLFYLFKNF